MNKKKSKRQRTKNGADAMGASGSEKWTDVIGPLVIIICATVVFCKVLQHKLVNWDDISYITQNPLIRDFSLDGIAKIFTTPVIGMYNPIPFLIYAVEFNFWGLNAAPYLFSNLLFHLLATYLAYRFICNLTGKYETATIVAFFFALHPMHVEVVCWASETKTSLFAIFYFVALNQYLKYISSSYQAKYLFYCIVFFVLSALSKPEAVTLAPMLILLDYYLARKWDKRLFIEKIPFFAIALIFGLLTLYTHSKSDDDIFQVNHTYSLINSLLVANYSIVFYIEKLLFPFNLSAIYPYPDNATFLPLQYYLAIPAIPLIAWLVYKSGRFRKEMIFGVLFFLISVSILLRLVPSGFYGMANRYSYVPYIGFFFIVGQYYTYVKEDKLSSFAGVKKYLPAVLGVYVVFCIWQCSTRVDVWEDSITLFNDVIIKYPKFAFAYDIRSSAKYQVGDYIGAIEDASKAIEFDPGSIRAYNNRTSYKWFIKDYQGALKDCDKALSMNPNSVEAHINRGTIYATIGHMHQALTEDSICIKLNPKEASAYYNMALIKFALRDTTGAALAMRKADEFGYPGAKNYIFASK